MPVADLLEDFGDSLAATDEAMTDVMIEDQKLDAFERGYQAGWEDSTKAQADSAERSSEDFARNLRDLSFTYQEAFAGIIAGMEPMMRQIVEVVLPQIAKDTLAERVAGILMQEIAAHGHQPVELVIAPESAEALRAILPDDPTMPTEIREDSSLAEGQVQLALGTSIEREIDLQEVLGAIATAVEGFFQETSQSLKETA